jgi:hypothetical protein
VTEVARLSGSAETPADLISAVTRLASLSGLIQRDNTLCLHAHSWIDESNAPLYDVVLGLVAGLQIREAAVYAQILAEHDCAELAVSEHPTNGVRPEPDDIAHVVDTVIRPCGADPPPWPRELCPSLEEQYFDRPPCLAATSDEDGLTAEFPFGTESSIVLARTSDEHPIFGRGLLVRNGFYTDSVDPALIGNPLTLNEWEVEHGDGPFFGSWTYPENGQIAFVTFIPNALRDPAAAANFILIAPGRARRMSIRWLNDDWSKTWDDNGNCRAKTAIERAITAGGIEPDKTWQ